MPDTKHLPLSLCMAAVLALAAARPASATAVPTDVVQTAVQTRAADPAATRAVLASCWADSAHTAVPRLQFCLAYEVVASGGTLSGPGIGGKSPAARSDAYFDRLGIPAALRPAELDRIRALSAPVSMTAGHALATESYKGRLDGGAGTLVLSRAADGIWDMSVAVSGHGCAGEVEGTARGDGARLSLLRAKDGQECALTVTRGRGRATVVENSCPVFHGASCDFNGTLRLSR